MEHDAKLAAYILKGKQRAFDAFADRSVAADRVDQAFSRQTLEDIVREQLEKYRGVG